VGPSWSLDDLDVEAMRTAFETSVFGVVRAALPLLRRSANPVIVNVARDWASPVLCSTRTVRPASSTAARAASPAEADLDGEGGSW
jgi:hypothetical protein